MHEGKCVLESTCLGTSLHLVHAKMVKTCQKKVNKKNIFFYIQEGTITHLLMKKKIPLLLEICMFLRELGNETYIFTILHFQI